MMLAGAMLQVLAHTLRVWNPPLPLFAITFTLASLGQAFNDTHANSFVAEAKSSHRWLALIHASYSAGCLIGPFVSTAVAAAATPSVWYYFYMVPLGLCVVNMAFIMVVFRDTVKFRRQEDRLPSSRHEEAASLIALAFHSPALWYLSIFYFFYLGSALTAGGWLVEYLVDVRNGDISQMGFVSAGFNGGSLLGRLLLAEPIHRFGPRLMLFAFAVLCIVFQLVFWLYVSTTL
jgi:fucose permease